MKHFLLTVSILLVGFLATYFFYLEKPPQVAPVPEKDPDISPVSSPPALLPARIPNKDSPLSPWERFLAEDGSAKEDRAALQDLVTSYLQNTKPSNRKALGPNEEFAIALSDTDAIGDSAIPQDHPALRNGEIIDRWGTPWFFHQESSENITTRSAGPDRRLFTPDDIFE